MLIHSNMLSFIFGLMSSAVQLLRAPQSKLTLLPRFVLMMRYFVTKFYAIALINSRFSRVKILVKETVEVLLFAMENLLESCPLVLVVPGLIYQGYTQM